MTIRKRLKIEREGVLEVHDPELRAGAEVAVLVEVEPVGEEEPLRAPARRDEGRKSLMQRIAEIRDSVPLEEWDRIPNDLSMHGDHYLYGTRRIEE